MIPGIPQADSQRLLELIRSHPHVQKVVLYGSRALGRQRATSGLLRCRGKKRASQFGVSIELRSGKTVLIPFVEAIVPEVQLEEGWLLLTPPPGLMEL